MSAKGPGELLSFLPHHMKTSSYFPRGSTTRALEVQIPFNTFATSFGNPRAYSLVTNSLLIKKMPLECKE